MYHCGLLMNSLTSVRMLSAVPWKYEVILSHIYKPTCCSIMYFLLLLSCSLSVSRSADHPWMAVGLQPGSLFQPQGNKTVHLYNWQEGKVHQIFDAGKPTAQMQTHYIQACCLYVCDKIPFLNLQVVVAYLLLYTRPSLHVDGKSFTTECVAKCFTECSLRAGN